MTAGLPRPCIVCGEPTSGGRCDAHTVQRQHTKTPTERGYDRAWTKLSARARRLQPWCSDCGATDDLTTDHSAEAWRRHNAGKPIRIRDVDVVCRSCNSKRGPARTRGSTPAQTQGYRAVEAGSGSHTPAGGEGR